MGAGGVLPLPRGRAPDNHLRPPGGIIRIAHRGCAATGYNRHVRELRPAGNDPSFLLKALSEAAGEVRRAFFSLDHAALLLPGEGFDDCWCLLAVAVHLRDIERETIGQFEAMVAFRDPAIPHVDMDTPPPFESYAEEDEDDVLGEFHHLRRETAYLLWDLSPHEWERGGIHPYRGRITVLDLARGLYQHDLEHLWQVRRMADLLAKGRS